jgi:hypothetical protein
MTSYSFTIAAGGRVQPLTISADYHALEGLHDGGPGAHHPAPTRVFYRDTRPIAWVPVSIIVDPPSES